MKYPELKNLLSKNAKSDVTNTVATILDGIVLFANEEENVCDVGYINSAGQVDFKSNIPYRIKNRKDEWFPSSGDMIKLEEANDNRPVIIEESVDYMKDIKKKRILLNDIFPNRSSITRCRISS